MFEVGQFVKSKAGRDAGKILVVYDVADGYVLVVDGKERPLNRPKKKNPKHLAAMSAVIDQNMMATNPKIKKAINQLLTEE